MGFTRKIVLVAGVAVIATLPYTWTMWYKSATKIHESLTKPAFISYDSFKPGDETAFLPKGCKSYDNARPLDVNGDGKDDFLKLCSIRNPTFGLYENHVAGTLSSPNGYIGVDVKVREGKVAKKGPKLELRYVKRQGKPGEILLTASSNIQTYLFSCQQNDCSSFPINIFDYCDSLAIQDDGQALSDGCWDFYRENIPDPTFPVSGRQEVRSMIVRAANRYKPKNLIPILRNNVFRNGFSEDFVAQALGEYKGILKPSDLMDLCPTSACTSSVSSEKLFQSMVRLSETPDDSAGVANYLSGLVKDPNRDDDACWNKAAALRTLASMNDPYARAVTARTVYDNDLPEYLSPLTEHIKVRLMQR